jgi:UDP-N-acetylglucosamine 2-epimerase (non-hydrolysing)
LENDGIVSSNIFVTGNTVIDALHYSLSRIQAEHPKLFRVEQSLKKVLSFDFHNADFILITVHRRENLVGGILEVCRAIIELADKFGHLSFVFPVHLNPKLRDPVERILGDVANVYLIEPLEYESFIYLLRHSYLVLTDSGGIQEEAPSLGKPVLVLRDTTERPEAVESGTVELVGACQKKIVQGVTKLLESETAYLRMSRAHNPYGDGKACARIVDILSKA